MLVADDHDSLLSPHLLDGTAATDPSLFMATTAWIAMWLHMAIHAVVAMWLHRMGMSYRAVTGDPKNIPQDHAEHQEASILRISGKFKLWDFRPSAVVFADETFANGEPSEECASLRLRESTVLMLRLHVVFIVSAQMLNDTVPLYMCRYTWEETNSKHVLGVDKDTKTGTT
jgi:hypothetical protein